MSAFYVQPGHLPYPLKIPSKADLDAAIEALLELRNAMDGDTDQEPEEDQCEAGDHGGGFVSLGHKSGWGAREDDLGVAVPIYGVDQSQGPINEQAAQDEYFRRRNEADR
jgi:hypothetical protein